MGALRQQAARTREVITNYRHMLETSKLDEHLVLIDARCGRAFMGNMFYIAKELVENATYKHLRIWVSAGRSTYAETKRFLQDNGLGRIKPVLMNSKRYFELLARAKFLISDVCFSANWTKQPGQIVWNTWHGTPIKCMGRQMHDEVHTLSIPQKNLLAADYLSFPNYHTAQHMLRDYMIDELFEGTLLFTGYPRNSIFFNRKRRKVLRSRLGLDNKRLYAYLPTYRVLPAAQNTPTSFQEILKNFDELLEDDEILFAKLHPLCADSIDFSSLKHVKPVMPEYELYDFLNICDALITDYSSVLFDFSITQNPVVLYTFDKENYLNSRGLYTSLDELPFLQANTESRVLSIIRGEQTEDAGSSIAGRAFFNKFCSWENSHAAADLCARVFLQEPSRRIIEQNCKTQSMANTTLAGGSTMANTMGGCGNASAGSVVQNGAFQNDAANSNAAQSSSNSSQSAANHSTILTSLDDGNTSKQQSHARRIKLLVHVGEQFFEDEEYRQDVLEKLLIANFKQVAIYLTFEIPSKNIDAATEVLYYLPKELKYFPLIGTYLYTPHELRIAKAAQKKHEKALRQPQKRGAKNYLEEIAAECGDAFKNANRRNFAFLKPDALINFDTAHIEKLIQFSYTSAPSSLMIPKTDNSGVSALPTQFLSWAKEHYSALLTDEQNPLFWATQELNAHGCSPQNRATTQNGSKPQNRGTLQNGCSPC